jgi:DnaJ-class molecular chaperone
MTTTTRWPGGGDPQEPPEAPDSPDYCQRCDAELDYEECTECGGTGQTEPGELYEVDPLWYGEDETEDCPVCDGAGSWPVCYACRDAARREETERSPDSPAGGSRASPATQQLDTL